MKKWIALLLVAVMCLSLVACGKSEEMEKYKKYETLINYLEAEDYESALEEMIKLSQHSSDNREDNSNTNNDNDVDSTQTVTTETTITFGVGDSKYADHPYLKDVYGTWEYEKHFYNSEYTLYKSLVLNEDGSCTIDGVDANWKLDDENTKDNYLYIGIYSNSEIIYAACFIMDTTYGFCMVPMSGLWAEPDGAVFTKK